MQTSLWLLGSSAASVGLVHTLLGPDHTVPFVVLAREESWPLERVLRLSVWCGLAHVAGSALVLLLAAALGLSAAELLPIDGWRGGVTAWGLMLLGGLYIVWGAFRLASRRRDPRSTPGSRRRFVPWFLGTIVVLGPCEPLLPLVTLAAATSGAVGVGVVVTSLTLATVGTMVAVVVVSTKLVGRLRLGEYERFTPIVTGGALCLCGIGMEWLGW